MLLDLADVHVSYRDVLALRGVDLTVGQGELVALLGANGAGKTTLLRTVSGLVRPTQGTVSFAGTRLDTLAPHRIAALGVGHVPEGRRIFAGMTVTENLDLGAYAVLPTQGDAQTDRDRIFELFPVLADRRDQDGATLSGGEQQLLAIGRALMARPKMLMLDEPFLGLSPMAANRVAQLLDELRRDGLAILLVEQNVPLALRYADRGYVLESGDVVRRDAASALRDDARLRAAYLGSDDA